MNMDRIKRILMTPGSRVVLDHNGDFMVEEGDKVYGLYRNKLVCYPSRIWSPGKGWDTLQLLSLFRRG